MIRWVCTCILALAVVPTFGVEGLYAGLMRRVSTMPPAPAPPVRGFAFLDYIFCIGYLLLTIYVSAKSAFAKEPAPTNTKDPGDEDEREHASLVDSDGNSADDQKTPDAAEKYFLAGRGASGLIVAISLLSGLTSGISFIGAPSYAYEHGASTIILALTAPVGAYIVSILIIPFYSRLRLSTPYTYLERRFSRTVRTAAAFLFVFRVSCYLAVVLQAPAILLNQSTGISKWLIVVVCGSFATLFTMKGGMKTVILTDFMQSIALLGGAAIAMVLAIRGAANSKPPGLVSADIRIDWSFFGAPSWRADNFWFMFIGPTFSYIAGLGTDQIAIQRLMAIKDSEGAKRAAIETGCWNGLITLVFAFTGVYIHAYYRGKGYDPAASDANSNKIMFTFLLEETAPGFVGIVSAAILGCTLSVMSGGLNAAATSFYVDILQNAYGLVATPTQMVQISKKLTGWFGLTVTLLAALSTMLHMDIVDFSNTVSGLFGGPVCAVFLCGMLTRIANTRGMVFGFACAAIIIVVVMVGEIACQSKLREPLTCREGILYFANMNAWMVSFWLGLVTAVCGLGASVATEGPLMEDGELLTVWDIPKEKSAAWPTDKKSAGSIN